MAYPTEQDKELYQKDVRQLIAQTGDPNVFILFDDPAFEKVKNQRRKKLKRKKNQ